MAKPIDPVKLDSSLKDPVRFMAFLRAWKQQFNMVHSMNAKPDFEDLIWSRDACLVCMLQPRAELTEVLTGLSRFIRIWKTTNSF